MTAGTPAVNSALVPMGEDGMPVALSFPLKADAQVGKLQFVLIDPSTGDAFLADDATPLQIAGGFGFPSELSDKSSTAEKATVRTNQRWCVHAAPSTIANDGFTAADVGTPFYIADANTPGKLSNSGGKNRSLGGLVVGLKNVGETPVRLWTGPIAQALARAMLVVNAASAGAVAYPADATAGTDIGSVTVSTSALMIPRTKTHGVLTSIEIIPSAALGATAGNDRTITVYKVDTLGVAADVIVGTFTTTTALTAHQPAQFTLSAVAGALNLLETDILCYSTVHAGAGAVIPQSALRANMKVI